MAKSIYTASGSIDGQAQTSIYNNFQKNPNSKVVPQPAIRQTITQSTNLNNRLRNENFYFNIYASSPGPAGLAGFPTVNAIQSPTRIGQYNYAGTVNRG